MGFSTSEGHDAAVKAMNLLEYGDRTEKELRERLLRVKFSEEAVEEAVSYVKSFGYINDARYSQNYIRNRLGSKSRQKIVRELMKKGIQRQQIFDAWEEIAEEEPHDEKEMIRQLIAKKHKEEVPWDQKEYRRIYGYLQRRGFHYQDIQNVLEENK